MIFLGSKSKQPVSGWIGRDVCLIDAADREGFDDAFVRSLAGGSILVIEWAFMLVNHDAVLFKRLVAVAVKFAGEQSFTRTERIGGIDDDQVIFILTGADKFQSVLVVDVYPWIIEAASSLRRYFLHTSTTSSSISTRSMCSISG